MGIEANDWRLQGQERHLRKRAWLWKAYRRPREDWDHDHCAFCWAKFMEPGTPGTLHEGYATENDYYWVCKTCFDDFKQMFEWTLASGDGA